MATAHNITLILLTSILLGWIYRSVRALSELKTAPTLSPAKIPGKRDRVSILVPAKNEAKNIADGVHPLLAQLREGDELLVINNGSTDGTEAILKELGAAEIKAVSRAGMGACGSKTCNTLIYRLFREAGIPANEVIDNTRRPMFMEVPLGVFAAAEGNEE